MRHIEAVIFDLDDTLISEREYAFSGFAAVAESHESTLGPARDTLPAMRALFDTEHRSRVFNALLEHRGIRYDEGLITTLITTYRRHIPGISLYPDADAALERFRDRFRLGVITDGLMVTQALKLKALQLRDRVDKIIITSELGADYGKPHPMSFEWMAKSLDVNHAGCVYVADNPVKDFIAPNRLGWLGIRIIRPEGIYRDRTAPAGGEPQFTIHSLDELGDIFSEVTGLSSS